MKSIEKYAYFIGLLPYEFMKMTPSEIYKCYKFRMEKIEFDNKSSNMRTARICCVLANINRDKKKHPKVFTEEDFMPKKNIKQKNKQSINNMVAVLKAITLMHGGKVGV